MSCVSKEIDLIQSGLQPTGQPEPSNLTASPSYYHLGIPTSTLTTSAHNRRPTISIYCNSICTNGKPGGIRPAPASAPRQEGRSRGRHERRVVGVVGPCFVGGVRLSAAQGCFDNTNRGNPDVVSVRSQHAWTRRYAGCSLVFFWRRCRALHSTEPT